MDRLKSHALGRLAIKLRAQSRQASRLSPLVFMTDPNRMPDLAVAVAKLPRGCAVIYRHFGEPRREINAHLLREVTWQQQQQLLIGGGDMELAQHVKACGVHFQRDAHLKSPRDLRGNNSRLIITMAGLKSEDYKAPLDCLDGLFVSSIFPSQSPSAGAPIGVAALKNICRKLDVPIFALGGVSAQTAPALIGSGACGFAAIAGLL